MKRLLSLSLITILTVVSVLAKSSPSQSETKAFTINDLIAVRRVADPQLSPDGRSVAFTITDTDKAANRRSTQIYLMSSRGGDSRQLTKEKVSSSTPRWSPDGTKIAFVSAR